MSRVVNCDRTIRQGRMVKAQQFADAATLVQNLAEEAGDVADAYITLCVHAGIAASDVICCARLGRYA
jgi:NTP pyrophosphatase (non-canonical NTP hydrolase)